MRITAAGYLQVMRNALAAQAPSPETMMMVAAIDDLKGRAADAGAITALIANETRRLGDLARAACPDAVKPHEARLQAVASDAGGDPAAHFLAVMTLFQDIIADLGPWDSLGADSLPLLAEIAAFEQKVIALHWSGESGAGEGEPAAPDVEAELRGFLAGLSPAPELVGFAPIAGGMSKQAFRLKVRQPDGREEDLILKAMGADFSVPMDCMVLDKEFAVLGAACASGVMAPAPRWLHEYPAGAFMVMETLPGACTTSFLTPASPIAEPVLLRIAEQMARLHAQPIGALAPFAKGLEPQPSAGLTAEDAVLARLAILRRVRDGFERVASPLEEYLFAWLRTNLPRSAQPAVLVHGDFTPHNCLWAGDELTAVLDWECAHFGHPAEDLAYIKPHIEQRLDWRKFLRRYEEAGGVHVSDQTIDYFNCYTNLRSVIISSARVAVDVTTSPDLRTLLIDNAFSAMFIDICMSSVRAFEAAVRA